MVIVIAAALAAAPVREMSLDGCADRLLATTARVGPAQLPVLPRRRVEASDLIALRDFGPLGTGLGNELLADIAPDRRRVALALRQADAARNRYCIGVVVIDVASGSSRLVDSGGELVRLSYAFDGLANFPTGIPASITPRWSPDGRSLLLLKRIAGVTQVWRLAASGQARHALTHEAQDVTAAIWSRDGKRIVFATDRGSVADQAAIDTEGLAGWHYDDRILPLATARPYARSTAATHTVYAIDAKDGRPRPVSAEDRARLAASQSNSVATGIDDQRRVVSIVTSTVDPAAFQSRRILVAHVGTGQAECRADACAKARGFWIEPGGRSVLILARDGWGDGNLTFYRWDLHAGTVVARATTSDLLLGCRPFGTDLLCARESPTQPRRLVLFNPDTGQSRDIFNPNPDYDRLRQAKTERLRLLSTSGSQTFADVVLPPDFDPRQRYPLVVVQYESRGFLRGGTGDEYPIPALAAAGMIVLSYQRTLDVAATAQPAPRNDTEFDRLDFADWADRRNVHSALIDAIGQLRRRGWVDDTRIGITGLSDGVGTAAYALLNTSLFAAAALSGCCEEPIGDLVMQGPAFSRRMIAAGYPRLSRPDPARWREYSLAQNAATFRTPLLVQAADREFRFSLPTIQTLQEAGAPVDFYVFPDEYHIKWQPAHRAAIYERTLRWFEFWFDLAPLPGQASPPRDELQRWSQLRERIRNGRGRPAPFNRDARPPTLPHR